MKTLYLIGGPMGVGKTTAGRLLRDRLPHSVFLDGDWCWDMHPFVVCDETKRMVTDNIVFLLNSFLRCSVCEQVVFCWVMQEEEIWETLRSRLDLTGVRVRAAALVCAPEELRRRVERDAAAGLRAPDAAARSLAYLPRFAALSAAKLDVTALTPEQTADAILRLDSGRGGW